MKLKPILYLLLVGLVMAGVVFWSRHGNLSHVETATSPSETVTPKAKLFSVKPVQPAATFPLKFTPVVGDKLAELTPGVRATVDENEEYTARLNACRSGITNLAEPDRQALYAFLLEKSPLDADQRGHVLKNELLDTLTAMQPPPAQLGDVLVQLYRNRNGDEVIRDYAVQHLASHYDQLETAPGQARQDGQAQVQAALWEAVRETDSSIAGTALLGLSHLATDGHQDIDQGQVAKAALKLASDPNAGELSRITALQVCANLGDKQGLPIALKTVQSGESVPLQISAVAALGLLGAGNPQAKALLQQLQQGPEPRLQQPAQLALQRIVQEEKQAASAKSKS